jgi:hypothetical protein
MPYGGRQDARLEPKYIQKGKGGTEASYSQRRGREVGTGNNRVQAVGGRGSSGKW